MVPSSTSSGTSQQSDGNRGARAGANKNVAPAEAAGFITTPHTVRHSSLPMTSFDPMQLLNPGKAPSANRQPPAISKPIGTVGQMKGLTAPRPMPRFQFTSTNGAADDDDDDDDEDDYDDRGGSRMQNKPSQTHMLDRVHRTEERSLQPQRRRKRSVSPTDSETSKTSKTASWSRNGGGSFISQHLKDKRKELQEMQGARHNDPGAADKLKREIEASLSDANGNGIGGVATEDLVDLTRDFVDLTSESIDLTSEATNADRPRQLDLTQDAQDGELDFYVENGQKFYVKERAVDDEEVCYGRIEGARLTIHVVPNNGRQVTNRPDWPPMQVKLQRSTNRANSIVKAYDPTGVDFGNLDMRTSSALKSFLDSPIYRLRMEARTAARPKAQFEAPGQAISATIAVYINLFGPRKFAVNPIGKTLSQRQVWLRTPIMMPRNVQLLNPHCMDPEQARMAKKAALKKVADHTAVGNSTGFRSRTLEEAQMETQSLFDSLPSHEDLPRLDADQNITSDLLDHQKQALWWMMQRETPIEYEPGKDSAGTLWRCGKKNGNTSWHNVITGHEISQRPRDMLGGLLADMMGLGKTLSVLALLSYTRIEAMEFENDAPTENNPHHPGIRMRNLKTTLLVCPVSVITNWEEQIMQHVRENGMSFYSYHGSNRRKSLDWLAQFDVVLTSYPVVKAELYPSNRSIKVATESPLVKAKFFRVVLDEAHVIRNPSTHQFNACCQINASRRWALTATPVQNKLEDFGALVRFLGCFPFDVNGMFAQFILSPFKIADPAGLKNLRLLVDTITLRRLKDRIDLAPRKDEIVYLGLSEEEQTLYNFFASDASKRLQAISTSAGAKTKLHGKGYMHILRSILCLRQICAHGKDLLKDADMKLLEGQSSGMAISVEEEDTRPALDEHGAYQVFDLMTETNAANCIGCMKQISAYTPDNTDDDEETYCTMMPCYQLLCNDCAQPVLKRGKEETKKGNDRMECPYCNQAWRISFCSITSHGLWRAAKLKEDLKNEPRKARMINRYEGPSTKTVELILRIKETALEGKALEDKGEMPIKSVVFSSWVTHLELISIALDNEGIEYTNMVGSMSRKQRREALDEFRESRTCNVFLVSLGTGGVGLNLTAASRVYLMDIGFNPMAEQQAIDRVHRLGQKREVLFTRFLIHNSIEVKILELQKKKMDLADLSMQRSKKMDKDEAVRARLEELQGLFK